MFNYQKSNIPLEYTRSLISYYKKKKKHETYATPTSESAFLWIVAKDLITKTQKQDRLL